MSIDEDAIVNRLAGTCDSGIKIADELGVELDEIEEVMCNAGYERCGACDWWFEVSELDDDGYCGDCQ